MTGAGAHGKIEAAFGIAEVFLAFGVARLVDLRTGGDFERNQKEQDTNSGHGIICLIRKRSVHD